MLNKFTMSFLSNIRHKLIIGKFLGIIYVPLNINTPPTIVDFAYPIPVALTYIFISFMYSTQMLNLSIIPKEQEVRYTMWLLIVQCCFITITKWIYCIVERSKLQDLVMNVNNVSIGYENVNLTRKSINNCIFILMIILYVVFDCGFNMYAQDKCWFYYLFALPLEIGNFEQYLIYSINNELYLILKYINRNLTVNNHFRRQINTKQLTRTYDDYKKVLSLAHQANKTFGFAILCSLSVTLTALITGSYQFTIHNTEIGLVYYSNVIYLIFTSIRFFFTIHNWNMLVTQVC